MTTVDIATRFGDSVRSLRHELGLSQEELAERAELHRTYIAGIECGGRNVTLKSAEKLAQALQVSTAALLQHAGEESSRPPSHSSSAGSFGGKSVDILMVEDNPDDVELTLQAFKLSRITNPVKVIQDGEAALDFLFCTGQFSRRELDDQPRLVLLDLKLPKVSGLEVLRQIKSHRDTQIIPVVVLTASQNSRDVAECRRLGAETFIVKPIDFPGLSQATSQLKLDWTLLKPPEQNSPDLKVGLPASTVAV